MGTFNLLLENLDPLAELLLQALFRSFWQGLLIAALVWLLLRVFRQASATTRHAVWLASLLIIAALPLIAIATRRDAQLQSSQVQPHRARPEGSPIVSPQATTPFPPVTTTITDLMEQRAAQRPASSAPRLFEDYDRAAQVDQTSRVVSLAESARVARATPIQTPPPAKKSYGARTSEWFSSSRWPLALVAVWLLVSAMMMARILHSYYALFRLRRALDAASGEQQDRARYLADLFGVRRRVQLFTTTRVAMPMTIGALGPIIVLPADLARTLSPSEFDSVVAHELAHIKRWDYLTNLLQRQAQAFLFFHPAVWFIARQLMIERELACDDWAVKMCEPRRYASCLARLVEILSDSRPLAAAAGILFGKHVISRRVEMILNRDRNATTAVSKPAVAYAIGLAAMLVAVCSLMSPVIAIPLGQQAKKQKKEVQVTTPAPSTAQITPLTPLAPEALPEPGDLLELAGAPDAPLPPPMLDAPEIQAATLEALIPVQDPPAPVIATPAPPAQVGVIGGVPGGVTVAAPAAPVAWGDFNLVQPPVAATIAAWGQDDKNKAPAIPEAELLSLLTDIVKRDTDPNVRNEALQGIYRMRSDAAVNTLIQLYDSVPDTKTKGEIIAFMLRRTGDNAKAIAKLTQIARSEKDEELRNRAIRYLGNVKGDEGANNLISIYDSLQDAKMKQYVIRSLAYNKSPKAIEKLKQIAKNDGDPQIRSAAIRSLYSVDSRLYLETLPPGKRVGLMDGEGFKFVTPQAFDFDGNAFQFDAKRWEEMQRDWQEQWKQNQERYKELFEKLQLDKMQFDGLDKLKIEMPKIEMKLKELDQKIKEGQDVNQLSPLRNQLRGQIAQVTSQLAVLRTQYTDSHPTVAQTRSLLNSLQKQLDSLEATRGRAPKAVATPVYRVAPTAATPQPRPAPAKGTGAAASTGSSL
jgi:beta-lactamase regulating signal transducer with metallopeptidase domain/tetratricopeptide (TPR) repeat protein